MRAYALANRSSPYGIREDQIAALCDVALLRLARLTEAEHNDAAALREALRVLSVLSLQSDRYRDDADFRDAVDSGLYLSGASRKVA